VTTTLRVGVIGCGLIGRKRAGALTADVLVGCHDIRSELARQLAQDHGSLACATIDELLGLAPDVVVVATTHEALAPLACRALKAGAHVLVEKPAGRNAAEVASIAAAANETGRIVKVGFNHRFHPAIARAVAEARSGDHGSVMFVRGRYGHGGRLGYEGEWRAQPERSGGGELIDQGMHLLDLCHWLLGPLPLHDALVRTNYWPMEVDDNAVITLGQRGGRREPWATFHVSCSEWKNEFALEIYCTEAKLQVLGLVRSYGTQRLRLWRMRPELGPPDLEEVEYAADDVSWAAEWKHLREAIVTADGRALLGDLASAHYAHERVEDAYRANGYDDVLAASRA
jgi:predicted dehydrogenase